MRKVPAGLVFVAGLAALVFALIGLFNSGLDSREVLLVALFGGSIVFLAVGASGLSRGSREAELG